MLETLISNDFLENHQLRRFMNVSYTKNTEISLRSMGEWNRLCAFFTLAKVRKLQVCVCVGPVFAIAFKCRQMNLWWCIASCRQLNFNDQSPLLVDTNTGADLTVSLENMKVLHDGLWIWDYSKIYIFLDFILTGSAWLLFFFNVKRWNDVAILSPSQRYALWICLWW